jgi:hypothetical protein
MSLDLNAARETLERAGLHVSLHAEAAGLVVGRREERVFGGSPEDDAEMTILEDVARLRPSAGGWLFFKWAYAPGPGPHDLAYLAPTLELGVAVALNYYAGSPVLIDGWQVPLHKHPEWRPETVAERVAAARRGDAAMWARQLEHTDRRHAFLFGAPDGRTAHSWPEIAGVSWTCMRHGASADEILWLRRDLSEAWIVPTSGARPRSWGWIDHGPEGWLQ